MLHTRKKEIYTSIFVAVLVGIISFYLLQLDISKSVGLSLLFGLLTLLFPHTRAVEPTPTIDNTVSDNTSYRLLEKKFKRISKKADRLEREKKTTEYFLASMSHEIRTPLNGIIGLTEILDNTALTKEQKEFVSMIRESSDNLRVIVNDVLDVSKINAGKMELEHIDFDFYSKVKASAGIFIPQAEEKGIHLNVSIDPQIPKYLIGDPTRLSQVIINLVSNALKFTDKGGKINVTVESLERQNDHVLFKLSVSDSGIGLSQEQQVKIFEAYSQATTSTTRKSGGTGLGLTISSKIVRSMGGELQVESEEGKGATFFFVITMKESLREVVEERPVVEKRIKLEEKEEVTEVSLEKGFKDVHVLVAEDNPINQRLIKIVLENLGVRVTLTANGQEAYDARISGEYDIIFMDVQMPVMDGIESTHCILEYEKENGLDHVPIIALTANALTGDKEKYMAEGMDDYATKPLDIKILEKLISEYCCVVV